MPTKEEIIEGLKSKMYSHSEVEEMVQSVSTKNIPSRFKKGDVVVVASGYKHRPAVVVKVHETTITLIPLSSTEDDLNLTPYKSRFFGEGWFGKYIITLGKEFAFKYFVGVFDNSRDLNKAIKAIKEYVNQI